jgi:hypothetical protein
MAIDTIEAEVSNRATPQDGDNKDKAATVVVVASHGSDVETGEVQKIDEKYYSKVAVYLMMVFAGLAVGSDG